MKKIFCLFIGLCVFSAFFVSCKKKPVVVQDDIPVIESSFKWYYFFDGSFKEIERLALSMAMPEYPWTEAVRISSISCEAGNNEKTARGFAIVNRLGVLVFDGENIELCGDSMLFDRRTAGNIVFEDNVPLFSVYRSAFFNNASTRINAIHPFLIQFNSEQKILYPILTVENFGFDSSSEITDFVWDGDVWTCSVKTDDAQKVDFSYVSFQAKKPLVSISPETAESSLFITSSSMEQFRRAQSPMPIKNAPDRLLHLLKSIPHNTDYMVVCYTAGGHSPRTYISSANIHETHSLSAKAILSDVWCGALFEDGTMFFNGAIPGGKVVNAGKNIAIRLPKLPAGFVYSGFTISASRLYASWEETSFFKTARSGFICVNLDAVLP
ncbi:MAG: hypothetical protein K2M50_03010 [Treponemataceae bacterium]|nr:hypothetical protein [Treponemataceae bacterium]